MWLSWHPVQAWTQGLHSENEGRRDRGFAAGELEPFPRDRDEAAAQVLARRVEGRLVGGRLALRQQGDRDDAVVVAALDVGAEAVHDLLHGGTGGLVAAQGRLRAAARLLRRAAL